MVGQKETQNLVSECYSNNRKQSNMHNLPIYQYIVVLMLCTHGVGTLVQNHSNLADEKTLEALF